MRVLITGAGGMIGQKLIERLDQDPTIGDTSITAIDLVDVAFSPAARDRAAAFAGGGGGGIEIRSIETDVAHPSAMQPLVEAGPDIVFHLAGIVSGEAEANLAKGYRVNLDGTRHLFDALAAAPGTPRVVFTSSLAVYGAPLPDPIPDDYHLTPLTSYGTQKAMGEALLADYSRRGLIDGIGIRLPTITVRPGVPNKAASGFFSGIIREPLAGLRAALPVPRSVRHAHASPRSAVGFLLHAADLDSAALGHRPNLMMPSVSVTVAEQIEALGRAAGPAAMDLIDEEPDPTVAGIIAGWPQRFAADRAAALGFDCEQTYDEIIATYIEDEGLTAMP